MPTWQRRPKPEWWFCTVHMGCLVIAPVLTLSASGQIHSVRRSPGLGSWFDFFRNIQNKIFCPKHSDTSSFLQNSCENPPKIPRLNFSHFQNYVLDLTTKWECLMFLTHAIKNYVFTFTTKWDFCFFSAVYGIWNFTISVHFDKILKTFDEKNNINLSMLSETYLGKCNFKK